MKGKNAPNPEEGKIRVPRRNDLEMFALVLQRMGADRILVQSEDGEERNVRIPGKLRKHVWIRDGDIVIIRLWEFQKSKADVVWRYLPPQVERLKRKGLLEKLPL